MYLGRSGRQRPSEDGQGVFSQTLESHFSPAHRQLRGHGAGREQGRPTDAGPRTRDSFRSRRRCRTTDDADALQAVDGDAAAADLLEGEALVNDKGAGP